MKKNILLLLSAFPIMLLAQNHIDESWSNSINPIFHNLDKNRISSGILLDYGVDFTNVSAYNGVVTDTNYVDTRVISDIYKTLFMSKVVGDTIHTPYFDKYAYNWARERFRESVTNC